jgi:hypothetical protein
VPSNVYIQSTRPVDLILSGTDLFSIGSLRTLLSSITQKGNFHRNVEFNAGNGGVHEIEIGLSHKKIFWKRLSKAAEFWFFSANATWKNIQIDKAVT